MSDPDFDTLPKSVKTRQCCSALRGSIGQFKGTVGNSHDLRYISESGKRAIILPCILSFAAFDTSETKCCMLSTTVVNSDSSFGFEACWLD